MELDVFFVQEKVVTKQLVVQHITARFCFLKDKLHVTEHSLVSQSS